MLKKFGLIAVAAVAALALGTAIFGGSQSANAETTAVVNVHCELITGVVPTACTAHLTEAHIQDLADLIGDEDGTLEASDFDSFEFYDASQLSEQCTTGTILIGCTMLIFTFVDDEKPVTLDTPSGLTSLQAGGVETDYVCDTDGDALGLDDDCSDTVASNGDGVVVFHVLNFNADRGDEKTVNVLQEAVQQSTTLTIVGIPDDIEIFLVEDTIATSGSVSNSNSCASDTDVADALALTQPNSTVAVVTLEDEDNTLLAMWPLDIGVDPPADDKDIAQLGNNDNTLEEISGNTLVTIDTGDPDLLVAYYTVVCGGSGTGETAIAVESLTDGSTDSADLTVTGAPASLALTAAPSEIKCDGSETSTVTVTATDSEGNAVVPGFPVNFTVVALGTANPINTETDANGQASTVVTPLSNSSAGVTVIVTVGDSSIETAVQTSTRVDCALPLETQPTLAPPGGAGPIGPPDTGSGGYLGQDNGSGANWLLMALAAAAGTVVFAGGLVARRAGK